MEMEFSRVLWLGLFLFGTAVPVFGQTPPGASPVATGMNEDPGLTGEAFYKANSISEADLYQEPAFDIEKIAANKDGRIEGADLVNPDELPKVEIIVDSSGSMGQLLSAGKTKMYYVKKMLTRYFSDQWRERSLVGMRVYGSRRRNDCTDNYLAVGFGGRSLSEVERRLKTMYPVGRTPLHESIKDAIADLRGHKGPKRVVIFTDGEETCDGDPCKLGEEIRKNPGMDIRIFVVAIGFGKSEKLKAVSCIGDTRTADNEEELFGAMGAISNHVNGGGVNLIVNSPDPLASVYLYSVDGKGRRQLFKTFTAAWGIRVPPGDYEAVVQIMPPFKFQKFAIPPKKRVTLTVDGEGDVKVNFLDQLLNVEVLDQNNKVVTRFKSDRMSKVPTGKWKLRIYKEPFFERLLSSIYVFPGGSQTFEAPGAGVIKVVAPETMGLYVYDSLNAMIGNYLTNFPLVLKNGSYRFHVNQSCTFRNVAVGDLDPVAVKTLTCP